MSEKLPQIICCLLLSFFLFLTTGSHGLASSCTDLLKSACEKKRNCNWVKGYTNDRGERVKGYCRKTAAKSKKTGQAPKDRKKGSSNPCLELHKVQCEKKRTCGWVTGYTNDRGERIKGYCRRKATGATSGKRGSTNCSELLKVDCENKRKCGWVTGYTNERGERVKGYCRKKSEDSKAKPAKNKNKKKASVCSELLKAECEKKRSCGWVKGRTNNKGERIKGYCRKQTSPSTRSSSKKKSDSTGEKVLDVLEDLLKSRK